jgi:hypothetical protein
MTIENLRPVREIIDQLAPIVRRRKEPVISFDEMPEPDVKAFRATYGFRKPHPGMARAKEYSDLLRNRGWWLGCTCRKEGDKYPLLSLVEGGFVRRMETGNRLRHSGYCPFHRDQDGQKRFKTSYKRPDGPISFIVRGSFRDPDPNRRESPKVKRKSRRRSATDGLQKILWSLLTEARINELNSQELNLSAEQMGASQRYRFQAVIDEHIFRRAQSGDPEIQLSDVICLDPNDFGQFARWLRQRPWPKDFRPQGFLLGVVDRILGQDLHFVGGRMITVKGDIAVFGEDGDDGFRPPYLALLSLAQETRTSKFIEPIRAYVHPIMSRNNWMPVDSENERITAGCLKAAMKRCVDNGMTPHLTKPLYDMSPDQADDAEVLIPDFLLNVVGPGVQPPMPLLIETMGYADEDYRQGKAEIHRQMETVGLGEVIEFDAVKRPRNATPGCPFDREFLRGLYRRIGIPENR